MTLIDKLLTRRTIKRMEKSKIPGCASIGISCRPAYQHGDCVDCGRLTCQSRMRIDPTTLRRRKMFVCWDCSMAPQVDQARLAEQRTKRDWSLVTDPIEHDRIRRDVMPEQLPSASRATIRAFYTSDSQVAVVPDVEAETLNQTIGTLGLHRELFAETRNHQTVIRKVK